MRDETRRWQGQNSFGVIHWRTHTQTTDRLCEMQNRKVNDLFLRMVKGYGSMNIVFNVCRIAGLNDCVCMLWFEKLLRKYGIHTNAMPSHRLLDSSIINTILFASIRLNKISINRDSWLKARIVITPWIVSTKCDRIGALEMLSMRCNSLEKVHGLSLMRWNWIFDWSAAYCYLDE